ncbi:hypothetical protein PGB90_000991 [Kerria lacca]
MYRNCSHLLLNYVIPQNAYSNIQSNIIFNVHYRFKSFKTISKSLKFKENINKNTLVQSNEQGTTTVIPNLTKPVIFTILFSSTSFIGATIWQYENMSHQIYGFKKDLMEGSFRQFCNTWWNSLSEGQKIFVPILVCNILVYIAWKIPSFRPIMMQYFISNSAKTLCLPMVLSTFSHNTGIHLAVNMFVLNSFIEHIVSNLGKEQFLAFYLSSGIFASLLSLVYRVCLREVTLSIGASGAIFGTLSYTCYKYPDMLLSIIFLPFLVFKAGIGIKIVMISDFMCLLLKFKLFDHAAHLGGALFGLFWYVWGNANIWQNRGPILEWWHKRRNRPH